MAKYFCTDYFDENDNSVKEYKESLCVYLKNILTNDLSAMSDHKLFLEGGEQALKEIYELIKE